MSTAYFAKDPSTSAEEIQVKLGKFSDFTLMRKSKSDFVIFENDNQIMLHLDQFGFVTGGTRYGQGNAARILEILDHECGLQFVTECEIDDYLKVKNANNMLILYRSESEKELGKVKAAEMGVKPVFVDQGNNEIDADYLDSIRMGEEEFETWHCQHWWISAEVLEKTDQEILSFATENPSICVYRS